MSREIFISHRHADHDIASVFSRHFQTWGVAQEEIFQSSDYQTSTVIGEPLRPQLKQALAEARLVLLIYTVSDADWEFCIWECGVATNPRDETPDTRVAMFQVGNRASRVFDADVVFKLTRDDIAKFVEQFHKHKGFFRSGAAFHPTIHPDILRKRTEDLSAELMKFSLSGKLEERYRWDRFTLRLKANIAREIRDGIEAARAGAAVATPTAELLSNGAEVIDSFGQALLHFGYTSGAKDLTLGKLVARWRENVAVANDPQGWIRELCDEMARAIEDRPSRPSWELMKSGQYPDWWFYPVVNHVRLNPDGSFEFDVYLYRLPGTLPTLAAVPPP